MTGSSCSASVGIAVMSEFFNSFRPGKLFTAETADEAPAANLPRASIRRYHRTSSRHCGSDRCSRTSRLRKTMPNGPAARLRPVRFRSLSLKGGFVQQSGVGVESETRGNRSCSIRDQRPVLSRPTDPRAGQLARIVVFLPTGWSTSEPRKTVAGYDTPGDQFGQSLFDLGAQKAGSGHGVTEEGRTAAQQGFSDPGCRGRQ
ncbi:MAG: hypothetical protein CM1200mP20_11420 [Pseudomonadota bacterium]|nr:MAG: hypothetical protein CM1200mP20_11420 [Pseudomonadota bacterium]